LSGLPTYHRIPKADSKRFALINQREERARWGHDMGGHQNKAAYPPAPAARAGKPACTYYRASGGFHFNNLASACVGDGFLQLAQVTTVALLDCEICFLFFEVNLDRIGIYTR
jgi:hypothetical protein